jgi:hypothetical protein
MQRFPAAKWDDGVEGSSEFGSLVTSLRPAGAYATRGMDA